MTRILQFITAWTVDRTDVRSYPIIGRAEVSTGFAKSR